MKATPNPLPPSLPPLALRRAASAASAVSKLGKFDELVRDGRMPKPRHIDGVVQWDVAKLRDAHAALPEDDEPHPWDEALGNGK